MPEFNVENIVQDAMSLVTVLFDTNLPNPEKLARVKAIYAPLIERLDDEIVLKLPAGAQPIAKLIIDNPLVDGFEDALAALLAEWTVQIMKKITGR